MGAPALADVGVWREGPPHGIYLLAFPIPNLIMTERIKVSGIKTNFTTAYVLTRSPGASATQSCETPVCSAVIASVIEAGNASRLDTVAFSVRTRSFEPTASLVIAWRIMFRVVPPAALSRSFMFR